MKKIEYRELKAMGASERALNLYSNTDPLTIIANSDGSYKITGCFLCSCSDDADLIQFLEDLAEECE